MKHYLYSTLLTYTTVKEFHHWIVFQESFQRPCSAGTDGIEVNVEERFFTLVSTLSGCSFRKPLGGADSIPWRNN